MDLFEDDEIPFEEQLQGTALNRLRDVIEHFGMRDEYYEVLQGEVRRMVRVVSEPSTGLPESVLRDLAKIPSELVDQMNSKAGRDLGPCIELANEIKKHSIGGNVIVSKLMSPLMSRAIGAFNHAVNILRSGKDVCAVDVNAKRVFSQQNFDILILVEVNQKELEKKLSMIYAAGHGWEKSSGGLLSLFTPKSKKYE
jgi:hypothetical protein